IRGCGAFASFRVALLIVLGTALLTQAQTSSGPSIQQRPLQGTTAPQNLARLSNSATNTDPSAPFRRDPPEQIFRYAPMANATRSIVLNAGTNLHVAFDTERLR